MGKKRQGARLRAKRRADQAAAEIAEATASEVETSRIVSKSDSDLFVLDTDPKSVHHLASPRRKRKVDKDGRKLPKNRMSAYDERKVRRIMENHGCGDGVARLANEGRANLVRKKRTKRLAGSARTNYDLWDDGGGDGGGDGDGGGVAAESNTATAAGTKVRKVLSTSVSGAAAAAGTAPVLIEMKPRAPGDHRILDSGAGSPSSRLRKAREAAASTSRPAVAVDVALQGQSYRPDPEAHQDAVGEALAVELRREEVREYNRAPIGEGLSEETRAIMVGSSDDDEDSDGLDDDEEGGGADVGGARLHRKREKLTRAQRNRQKRVRAEKYALERRREDRRLLASVNDAGKHARDLAREERDCAARRAQIAELKAEAASRPLGKDLHSEVSKSDPLRAPTVPVALTEELREGGGALRTVKPKGSLLTDRIESFQARNMASRKVYVRKMVAGSKRRKIKPGKDNEFIVV